MQRKKLPIGIQTFREIRENGHYYVDKTPFALRLIDQGKPYFLSRPRRFGKSLFLDTLKELFEGNRALFAGLHAEERWDWSKQHPVLRLSFSDGVLETREDLAASIHRQLSRFEQDHWFSVEKRHLAEQLGPAQDDPGRRRSVTWGDVSGPVTDLQRPARFHGVGWRARGGRGRWEARRQENATMRTHSLGLVAVLVLAACGASPQAAPVQGKSGLPCRAPGPSSAGS
jgi:hypothetical protein